MFKDAQVIMIGSAATELCGPHSDVDFLVQMKTSGIILALDVVARKLKSHNSDFELKYVRRLARVPVIRAEHQLSQTELDITFDCPQIRRNDAIKNTQLIKLYGENCRTFKKLYLFVKLIWGDTNIFDSKKGGLSSYAHAITLIYFLINKLKCTFINPENLTIINNKEICMPLAQKLIQYMLFIKNELEYTKIDITKLSFEKEINVFEIKDPFINKNHAKNFSVKNLQLFKSLATVWIEHFQSRQSGLLLQLLKTQINNINNSAEKLQKQYVHVCCR